MNKGSGISLAFVANGVIHNYSVIAPLLKKFDRIIAVDGGLKHCHKMEIAPAIIVGDMDSVPKDLLTQYSQVPLQEFPRDKDETDLEIALRIEFNPTVAKMVVFGALEGRTDHTLYNLQLLTRYPEVMAIQSEKETIFAITKPTKIACEIGQTISLLPLKDSPKGVTTKGLKWELNQATLHSSFMSLSNVCLKNSVEIDLNSGNLLCCLTIH